MIKITLEQVDLLTDLNTCMHGPYYYANYDMYIAWLR